MQEQQEESDGEDYSGDEITDFTITCDSENPEVVRRSKREPKIKNYAEFLKNELGSDLEYGEEDDTEQAVVQEVVTIERGENMEETIKPIVRSEGTKVYQRKTLSEKPKMQAEIDLLIPTAAPEEINQPIPRLENLGLNKQLINGLPNKQFINVKVGDKMMRVQKFIVSKAEVEAMAREGKLEIGGDNILLKVNKPLLQKGQTKNINLENIIEAAKPSPSTSGTKMLITKTYTKKTLIQKPVQETVISVDDTEPEKEPEIIPEQTSQESVETVEIQ